MLLLVFLIYWPEVRVTLFVAITDEKCIVRKKNIRDCSSAIWETDCNRVTLRIA
jgi:hypothetical protein